MGPCLSCLSTSESVEILGNSDGGLDDYNLRFEEDRVLGEGSFGVVKLVREKTAARTTYACKTLKKGAVWKNNTLYPPIPTEVLRTEVTILQTLKGEHFCLKLEAVYETPKDILLISECCTGGEMMEYVALQKTDLRTEDISRIAYQLLDAVNHCNNHNIIHRDLKPENTMFTSEDPGAELRLIDFGLSTNKVAEEVHTTYSGTPFYNSPEMFQHKYTNKTDVW
jgi:serine/threonine protein kinase